MLRFYTAGLGAGTLFVRKITRSPRGERLDSGFNEAEPKWAVSGWKLKKRDEIARVGKA